MKRFRKILKFLGVVALWCAILFVLHLISTRAEENYANLKVSSLNIMIADSTSRGNLVSTHMVREILKREKIETIGANINSVPLSRIERVISENGFVETVKAYTNAKGELNIDIEQRTAVARILLDGYNCYITSSGFVFRAPSYSSLYTSVVTGSYRPFFPAGFTGNIDEYMLEQMAEIDREIEAIEREKYPIMHRELVNNEERREIRKRYTNRRAFENRDQYLKRVADLREENRITRERIAYRQKRIDEELEAIERRVAVHRERQKKIQKSCEDIHNLITFVEIVENDDFWRSEVVQINLTTGLESSLRLSMSVRSADFRVSVGSLKNEINWVDVTNGEADVKLILKEDEKERSKVEMLSQMISSSLSTRLMQKSHIEKERKREKREVSDAIWSKLNRLRDFYDEALPRVGWDRYKEISIEFENQVVCKR